MNNIKKRITPANILFLLGCMFMLYYGYKFNTIPNKVVMVVTIAYVFLASLNVGRLRFDINLLFLMETFFIKTMLDQHTGRAWMVPDTMAMPMLMYLFGMLLVSSKENSKPAFGCEARTIIATILFTIGAFAQGLLVQGIVGPYFAVCIIVAAIIWVVYYIMSKNVMLKKCRKYMLGVIFAGVAIICIKKYVSSIYYIALKEGISLLIEKHWGNFATTVFNEVTTGNSWLDYGKDYGILVFIPLLIFLILTIKDVIKLAYNQSVDIFTKSLLITIYFATNIYYFTNIAAYTYPCYWYVGLIFNGMISVVSHKKYEDQSDKNEVVGRIA